MSASALPGGGVNSNSGIDSPDSLAARGDGTPDDSAVDGVGGRLVGTRALSSSYDGEKDHGDKFSSQKGVLLTSNEFLRSRESENSGAVTPYLPTTPFQSPGPTYTWLPNVGEGKNNEEKRGGRGKE